MKKSNFYLHLKKAMALCLCLVMMPFSFVEATLDDATLKNLSFDELVYLDFASETYDYTVVFPYNHQTGEYVVPEISYEKNDEMASVEIVVPDGIKNGDDTEPVKITVTAEDNVTQKEYKITPVFAGGNVYANGSFENGTDGWGARTCSFEIVETGAVHGEKALKVSGNSNIRYWDPTGANLFTPVPEKTYLSSYQIRLAPDAEVSAYTDKSYIEWMSADKFGGTVKYLTAENETVTSSTTIDGDWQRLMAVFSVTNDRTALSSENYLNHHPLNWAANRPPYLVDDYYASELVAVSATIEDGVGNTEIVCEPQESENVELSLKVKLLNQLGNIAGVEEEFTTLWKLKEETEGISVSNGTVTVSPDAEPGEYEIIAEITPMWTGAAQEKIIAKTTATVKAPVDRSAAELLGIKLGDLSVAEFNPKISEYSVKIPYKYIPNDFTTVELPEISYLKKDDGAEVTVTQEGTANSGTVTLDVVNGDVSKTYKLHLSACGVNLFADGGFEGNNTWSVKNANSAEITTENVAVGSQAMKIDGNASYVSSITPNSTGNTVVGRTYLTHGLIRAEENSANKYAYHNYGEMNSGSIDANSCGKFYTADGDLKDNNGLSITNNWMSTYGTYTPKVATAAKWGYATGRDHTLYVTDENYFGDLTVNSIKYKGRKSAEIIEGSDENDEIVLSAEIENAFGNKIGIENETVEFSLLSDYEGVSVSDGKLVLTPDAEEGNIVLIMTVNPTFGAVQGKITNYEVIEVEKVPYVDKSSAELLDIKLGSLSVPDFNPKNTEYNVIVPYTYIPNDFTTVNIPEVSYIKKDKEALVEVSTEGTADGGTVTLKVTNSGIEKIYKLNLSTCGINLYSDGGFEEADSWVINRANSISHITQDTGAGNSSIAIDGDASYVTSIYPKDTKKTIVGRTYLTHGMICLSASSEHSGVYHNYSGMNSGTVYANEQGFFYMENGDKFETNGFTALKSWMHTYGTYTPKVSTEAKWGYATGKNHTLYFADEYYFGDLTINSIRYTGETEAVIPKTVGDKIEIPLEAKIFNAFGNKIGLENEKIVYSEAYDYPGVTISDDKLYVSSEAVAGDIIINMTVNPSFGSVQGKIVSSVVVNVKTEAQDAEIPKARYVEIKRDTNASGYVLDASYYYYHALGSKEGASVIKWLYSDDKNGTYTVIPEATGLRIEVGADYRNKFICFEVKPVTDGGVWGNTVRSNIILPPQAPTAEQVSISGIGAIGETFTGKYEYRDANGDKQGKTTFRWLIADSMRGSFLPIEGATNQTYVITEKDAGKYIKFEVTPKSSVEPETGEAFLSEAMLCATVPEALDVEIVKNSSDVYSVSYKYYHPLGIAEGKTKIEWYLEDEYLGDKNIVTAASNKKKSLYVTVTPVAVKEPSKGESVTTDIIISGKSSSVGKSSGGGGGGGGKLSSAIVPIPEKTEAKETEIAPQITKHWAADGVDFALSKGIMQNLSQNNFEGEKLVTRADFVLFVIKTLGEQETEYNFEFNDVKGTDYFAGALQKAVNLGIISKDENFYPERNVSREEICKILVTAMGLGTIENPDLTKFADNENIAEWAKGYVAQANIAGILKGVSETEFMPKGMVTRYQTAVIIKRLNDYKNGGSAQ